MGRCYAEADGLGADVAGAIAQHYQPQGPSDDVPVGPVAQAVALADLGGQRHEMRATGGLHCGTQFGRGVGLAQPQLYLPRRGAQRDLEARLQLTPT